MLNFKEEIYELAFGDGAINKGYTEEEVVQQIKKQSEELQRFGQAQDDLLNSDDNPCDMSEDDFEYYERVIKEVSYFAENGELESFEEDEEEDY